MPTIRDLIDETRAIARGERSLEKRASHRSDEGLSPAQIQTLADRLEKVASVKEASDRVVAMKQEDAPQALTEIELKKLAYQQAIRDLGFRSGRLSPEAVLLGDIVQAEDFLTKKAADHAAELLMTTMKIALSDEEVA